MSTIDWPLLVSSLAAWAALAGLVALLVRGRYWRTPEQRSVLLITLAVTGLVTEANAHHLGLPYGWHSGVAATLYLVVAVASGYRFKVLLADYLSKPHLPRRPRRTRHVEPTPDPAVMWRAMRKMAERIEHMAPCPNPDCNSARRRIIELTAALERGHHH